MLSFAFLCNLPWTIIGLLAALLSVPTSMNYTTQPFAIIFRVGSFWWLTWMPWYKGARAITNGHVVSVGPNADIRDLQHELVHVEQGIRYPLIFPFLHTIEWLRRGYRNNKYEAEAFARSGSRYTGNESVRRV